MGVCVIGSACIFFIELLDVELRFPRTRTSYLTIRSPDILKVNFLKVMVPVLPHWADWVWIFVDESPVLEGKKPLYIRENFLGNKLL